MHSALTYSSCILLRLQVLMDSTTCLGQLPPPQFIDDVRKTVPELLSGAVPEAEEDGLFVFRSNRAPQDIRQQLLALSAHVETFDLQEAGKPCCTAGVAVQNPKEPLSREDLRLRAKNALARAKPGCEKNICYHYEEYGTKNDIDSIAGKNRIGGRFAQALVERESILVLGHKDPDEDCISSMVAFALLAAKFNKRAMISIGPSVHENFTYLLQISRYNGIEILRDCELPQCDALVLVDTPKPSMIDRTEMYEALRADPNVLKLEIDHHLEADSRYFTDPDYSLVYQASSACEIIGWLALKIQGNSEFMSKHHIRDLLTRNLVLAILSGILGDTQMGRLIKTRRERQYYERFTSRFERILTEKTHKDSGNLATKEQIYQTLMALSNDEEACWQELMARVRKEEGIYSIVLDRDISLQLIEQFGNDICVAVSKSISNQLAEDSGKLGLVAYYEFMDNTISGNPHRDISKQLETHCPTDSPQTKEDQDSLVQFRLRRSQTCADLDLRDFLLRMNIENGGGHPGAVGFRMKQSDITDIHRTEEEILSTLKSMLHNT